MTKIHPAVEQAVDTLGLPAITRRRLVSGAGLANGRITFDKPVAETSVGELTDLVVAEYRAPS